MHVQYLRFALVFLLLLASPVLADSVDEQFQRGLSAWNKGDYATALQEWRPLAVGGAPDALFYLGAMYDFGFGVPENNNLAADWYLRAANKGHAKAQFNLGTLYMRAIVKSCVWVCHAAARSWRSPFTNLTPRMISAN